MRLLGPMRVTAAVRAIDQIPCDEVLAKVMYEEELPDGMTPTHFDFWEVPMARM